MRKGFTQIKYVAATLVIVMLQLLTLQSAASAQGADARTATYVSNPPKSLHSTRHNDFLTPSETVAQSSSCSKPVNERTAAWACLVPRKTGPVRETVTPDLTSYCPSGKPGCWYTESTTAAEFLLSSNIAYGYGSKTLGYTTGLDINWGVSGSNAGYTSTKGDVTFSGAVNYVDWTGSLENAARGVSGSVIKTCPEYEFASGSPGQRLTTPVNVCLLQDKSNYDHSMATEISWQVEDYPGYWYIFAFSVVAHSTTLGSGVYQFQVPSALPANYFGSGYSS